MVDKLPLDSPLWGQLSACLSAENAVARLREIVATRQLDEAWQSLCDEILHQGSVYGVSSAAIPHLVGVAPYLPARSKRDLWIEIGFLVTSGADRFPSPPAPGLQEGLSAALRTAEALAVQDFLADADLPPGDSSYYALACIALAGHPVGRAMWQFLSAGNGYVDLACPGCGAEHEVDGFADPLAPPCPAPAFAPMPDAPMPDAAMPDAPASGPAASAWQDVAAAVDRCGRGQVLGADWADFLDTGRQVAVAGVPQRASSSAVWCLVAAMVATSSDDAAPWARTLTRLAGHFRCPECDRVWTIADAINEDDDAEPVEVSGETGSPRPFVQSALFGADDESAAGQRFRGSVPADTIADGIAGFRPSPSRELRREQLAVRMLWRADGGAVDSLTRLAGQPAVVVAAGRDGVALRDPASGSLAGPPLAGPATTVASLTLPDGGAVIAASGGDGGVRWWDGLTGRLLDAAATNGSARALSLAPVRMPASPNPRTAEWLAGLWDGRMMLAVGDADGVIRLWDPVTRAPLADISRQAGQPVLSMTAVEFTDLVAVYGNLIVDVWSAAAVHGNPKELATARKLAAVGHRHIVGVAVSPERRGHRRPVLLADRDGLVSMWETFGVRLSDPLPPDPAHREVVGITVLPAADAGIAVATASRADRSLRIWEPLGGSTALVPLDVIPRCLFNVGDALLIGHDDGLLALTLVGGLGKAA